MASEAEGAWGISIPVIGDPHHEIREDLKGRGWIDIFFNEDYGHLRERSWASHPKGYYQPAVIAVDKTSRILYRWRSVPKFSNIAGAGARPEANYTWERIKESMSSSDDAEADINPVLSEKDPPWFLSLLVMTAHGWFIRPRAFPLARDGSVGTKGVRRVIGRLIAFLCLWVLALIMLPIQWVVGAAIVWMLIVTPGVIEMHRQFQNEKDPF